jgi:succinyl-CoA synthetase alpha subunit
MIIDENMKAVIVKLQNTVVDVNFVSPNFVNEVANNMGRDLTSEQVVYISDHISYIDFIGLQNTKTYI